MNIRFEKVILHNFLSYGHSEILLNNKGYCLVSGVNNNIADCAVSNGAGKSTWSSAICWALTGQTIQGISTNIKNINIDENLCYVELFFYIDKDFYVIKRFKEPKSDLKIFINNEEKSGKGIRESEAILSQYIPDLTSNLIGSIIILGQGLPYKFTSNTPSGRKEVLEKLSKSDFMIQDIKDRLLKVISKNNLDLREVEDSLLASNTKINLFKTQKEDVEKKLEDLYKPQNFDVDIEQLNINIVNINKSIIAANRDLSEAQTNLNISTITYNNYLSEKNSLIQAETTDFNNFKSEYLSRKNVLNNEYNIQKSNLNSTLTLNKNNLNITYTKEKTIYDLDITKLEKEIRDLKSIKDVCPTCGQKLPHIIKPDTTEKENKVKTLKESLISVTNTYNSKLKKLMNEYQEEESKILKSYNENLAFLDSKYSEAYKEFTLTISEIEKKFEKQLKDTKLEIDNINRSISSLTFDIKTKETNLLNLNSSLNKLKLDKDNYLQKIEESEKLLLSLDNNIKNLDEKILYYNNKKSDISARIEVDNKISTLIKRDFRGFLLSNVINFIDSKCKEYCKDIFGNSNLDFILNGNNIEISYLGKSFENLSGGEKQKVDLIIQFSIRDMMSQYLDFSSNILILDEIFDQLDTLGCNNLLNLISNKLNDIESTFIISHRANELAIPYDCEMVIIKDNNGISKVKE